MRKIHATITTNVILDVEDDSLFVKDVLDELDYSFISTVQGAVVVDTEILDTSYSCFIKENK